MILQLVIMGSRFYHYFSHKQACMTEKLTGNLTLPESFDSLGRLVDRYKASFENSRDAVNIFSLDRKILDVNESLCRLSGYSKSELLNMSLYDLYPEALSEKGEKRLATIKERKQLPLFETYLITKSKDKIPVEIAVTRLEKWDGDQPVCQINIRDISASKAALKKLKKSEEKYRNLIECLEVGVARSTPGPQGRFLEVNQALADILGCPKDILFKKNLFEFHKEHTRAAKLFNDIQKQGIVRGKEAVLIREDGSEAIVSYTGKAIKNDDGLILYIDDIIADITQQKNIEKEIQKTEKLKSIGALAGGIAHNFNNIMTGLYGNISLAKLELNSRHQAVQYLNSAEESMQEGISLTKQLLTFAKGGDPIKEEINIAELAHDVAMFSLSGSNIRLHFSHEDNLWQTHADRSQISQVVSSIIINGRQAMPEGGEMTIHIENSTFLKDNLLTVAKGRYLKLTFTDTGFGIHQKHLNHIFDPYFTTKKEGSGMGLSICYSIVKKHDGHIFISSQVGAGTRVTVYIPAFSATQNKEPLKMEDTAQEAKSNRQRNNILIMDDEDHIRILLKKMLAKFGYHVTLSENGTEAVEKYHTAFLKGTPPDLVIMDLTIPGGMGGKEAAQKILEIDPSANIAVSSGYSTDPIMTDYKEFGLKGIIPKPYRMNELQKMVEQLLVP